MKLTRCNLHNNECEREFYDIVSRKWFPICEECYRLFYPLAHQSAVITAMLHNTEPDSAELDKITGKRFRTLIDSDET